MKIETKFNVGDTFYYMKNNKIRNGKVGEIDVGVGPSGTVIEYCSGELGDEYLYEDEVFGSTEELVNSLLKEA